MSWLRKPNPYKDLCAQAQATQQTIPWESPWCLEVFEVSKDAPEGRRFHTSNIDGGDLINPAKLRIIFAPLDLPRSATIAQLTSLFRYFDIPDEFTTERTVGACHSFAKRTKDNGFTSWFHFLCKNIELKYTNKGVANVANRAAELGYLPPTNMAEADYSWKRSGFFLRDEPQNGTSLVCFGASIGVKQRLEEFIAAKAWDDVERYPFILFDLVLEGLYFEVDQTISKMTKVFGTHEHNTLSLQNGAVKRKVGDRNPFTGLHNCAKHVIHLSEAVESCLLLTQSIISASSSGKDPPLPAIQLQESLQYRLSVFHSTQLKLTSLQKRIDNAINLSFNLGAQQDSLQMIQDSQTMRSIAFMTMVFLPTTGVAAVAGSQLLVTTYKQGKWDVTATPMFWLTWWIAIPLTIFILGTFLLWNWWAHGGRFWWGCRWAGVSGRWKRS